MPAKKTPKFKYHKGDYVAMKQEAQSMSWTPEGELSIEEKWHQFMNNIKHLMDKHPQIKITYAKWEKTTYLHDSKG